MMDNTMLLVMMLMMQMVMPWVMMMTMNEIVTLMLMVPHH
jgi:hypothetical protein